MIIQSKETKAQPSLIDLLGGGAKGKMNSPANTLFATLLNSLSPKEEGKPVAPSVALFQTIIDPKKTDMKKIDGKNSISLNGESDRLPVDPTKNESKSADPKKLNPKILSAQNSDEAASLSKELKELLGADETKEGSAFISKELLDTLSTDQVRTLIHRAKEYLKDEIAAKAPEYQNDAKPLPKTLAGLVQLAEKLELNPREITLSAVITDIEEQKQIAPELLSKPLLETKMLTQLFATPQEPEKFDAIKQLLSDSRTKEAQASHPASITPSASETAAEGQKETPPLQPLRTLLQGLEKREPSAEPSGEIKPTEPKTVETKPSTVPTARVEGLIALLQGEIAVKEGKSEGDSGNMKLDGDTQKILQTPKADAFEVKTKEAQQSMRLFAADLKEAVQEYKPPFTRLTMKLNPEKLGEVEVTLVQRGNNVHINIHSSSTNSVAFLAHNATELKAQLAHQGITNATMNFMSGGDSQTQQEGQQRQPQNPHRSYSSFEELELSEEQLSALEIIIPHYA